MDSTYVLPVLDTGALLSPRPFLGTLSKLIIHLLGAETLPLRVHNQEREGSVFVRGWLKVHYISKSVRAFFFCCHWSRLCMELHTV